MVAWAAEAVRAARVKNFIFLRKFEKNFFVGSRELPRFRSRKNFLR